jgi:hypothetical protein
MAEMADIVEAVEIGATAMVDQPDALAAHELDRLGIGDRQIGQQRCLAALTISCRLRPVRA